MKQITAILLAAALLLGMGAYKNADARLQAMGDTLCSVVGQDSTMAVYYQLPNIRIPDYPAAIDMGTMTPEEQQVFLDILEAVENREDRVPYSENVNLYRILTHLGMYYGSEERVWELIAWTKTEIHLRLNAFDQHEKNKVLVEARVEELLSALKEGSDRFKLFQIAACLSERMVYEEAFRESVDGLNGKGVCATYAMLFYKAASRLGIQTHICYGEAGGGGHAWNMVELEGEAYFYDVTWFDSDIYDFQYLHSTTGWDREYVLNNLWWEDAE